MWVEPARELLWESSEDTNNNSSGEDAWPDPIIEEVEEEEEVEFPLPTMGVPPLDENDEPYPDPWIGAMDMKILCCLIGYFERLDQLSVDFNFVDPLST
ncbi:hypothetical protein H6P81_006674 [Aristolochia fimbriata]|uniref:Uncharacterized protein n=1 Tax=Aristolochia fimbriata TaxID=158543 RepID=A0AAV7EXZ0_ARIFI|nr:hypothetical protein H6P81_006674 [Aristolochia fimbriata]